MLSRLKYLIFATLFVFAGLGQSREAINTQSSRYNPELEGTDSQTTLISADGRSYSIASDLLHQSPILSDLLEQHSDIEITLENIDSPTLKYLIAYLENPSTRRAACLDGPLYEDIDKLLDDWDINFIHLVCQENPSLIFNLYQAGKKIELESLEKLCLVTIVQLEKVNLAEFNESRKITQYTWHSSKDLDFINSIRGFSPNYLINFINLFWNKSGLIP
ncbi:MAG: hypothetical protein AB8F94_14175 [Saprospiraceae bacterium]